MPESSNSRRSLTTGLVLTLIGNLGVGWFGWASISATQRADDLGTSGDVGIAAWIAGIGGFAVLCAGIMSCLMSSVRFRSDRSSDGLIAGQ
jgi:hypothetical protein